MLPLTKKEILEANLGDLVSVDVPAWGGKVFLRPLSGKQATAIYSPDKPQDLIVQELVTASIVDEKGVRMFTPEEGAILFEKSYTHLQPIIEKAMEVNRMTKASAEAAKKD